MSGLGMRGTRAASLSVLEAGPLGRELPLPSSPGRKGSEAGRGGVESDTGSPGTPAQLQGSTREASHGPRGVGLRGPREAEAWHSWVEQSLGH